MRAIQIPEIGKAALVTVADPVASAGEAVVELKAAALNHRDLWIKQGKYAGLRYPCIPGSDGAGIVTSVGEGVDRGWIGKEVIINPGSDWGPNPLAQGPDFKILGLPHDGTLADRVVVSASKLSAKPAHLSWEEAAALPLAGLTAWRALVTRAQMGKGDRVLVTGIGGGVALLALKIAVASGNEVWVTSSSDKKIRDAVALGAKGGFRYDLDGWVESAAKSPGTFQVIIDSAGGPGFARLLDAAAPGGRITFFGATRGNAPELVLRKVFWKQLTIVGSTMGNDSDWASMMSFVAAHGVKPVVSDVFPFERGPEGFDLMEKGGQFGKIVIKH
ncbi:MAG TPA: zinc-binding dehydrogenase [Opitutaceae bacterium]|jgi:NADPH:quinone reductase-like Zn-dependent oxidoreductase|nr:zinc-binding dehydrogenase [Opitutaceae bacterium]